MYQFMTFRRAFVLFIALIIFGITIEQLTIVSAVPLPPNPVDGTGKVREVEPSAVDVSRGVDIGSQAPTLPAGGTTQPIPNFPGISSPVWVTAPGRALNIMNDLISHGVTDVRRGLHNSGPVEGQPMPDFVVDPVVQAPTSTPVIGHGLFRRTNSLQFSTTVRNNGNTASTATTLATFIFYQYGTQEHIMFNENETNINALAPGASQNVTINVANLTAPYIFYSTVGTYRIAMCANLDNNLDSPISESVWQFESNCATRTFTVVAPEDVGNESLPATLTATRLTEDPIVASPSETSANSYYEELLRFRVTASGHRVHYISITIRPSAGAQTAGIHSFYLDDNPSPYIAPLSGEIEQIRGVVNPDNSVTFSGRLPQTIFTSYTSGKEISITASIPCGITTDYRIANASDVILDGGTLTLNAFPTRLRSTPACVGAPPAAPPVNPFLMSAPTVNVSSTSHNSVTLTWNDVANESAYLIERRTGSSGFHSWIGYVNADVTTYTDTTVMPNTNYSYRVIAWPVSSAYQSSAPSAATSTTTSAGPPIATPVTIYGAFNVRGNSSGVLGNVTIANNVLAGQVGSNHAIQGPTQVEGNLTVAGGALNITEASMVTIGDSGDVSRVIVEGDVRATQFGYGYSYEGNVLSLTNTSWSTMGSTVKCDEGDIILSCSPRSTGALTTDIVETYTTFDFPGRACTIFGRAGTVRTPAITVSAEATCFSPDGQLF